MARKSDEFSFMDNGSDTEFMSDTELSGLAVPTLGAADDGDAPLDLSGINENAGLEPLMPGVYPATVDKVEFAYSSANNPQMVWVFAVPYEGKNRKLYYYTPINTDGLPRFKRTVIRIHPEIDQSRIVPKQLEGQLKGKPCQVRVKNEPYEGQMRSKVTDVLPARVESNVLD